ncbi:MAG: rhamnosyltransferase subunit [Micromonosporaceae bacterium]
MVTFALCTDGTHGDVLPFVQLGQALAARGHDAVLYSHAAYARTAAQAGLRFVPTDTEDDYARELADRRHLLLNVLGDVDRVADFYARNRVFEQTREEFHALADLVRTRPAGDVVLVGRHTSRFSVLLVREALGVPTAWVCVTPTQHLGLPMTEWLYPKALAQPMNAMRATVGLPAITDWSAWLRSADLVLGLWPEWFDQAGQPLIPSAAAQTGPAVALAGFLPHDPAETGQLPAELAALVDDNTPAERRPVLVSGGSSQLLHDDWYAMAVEAAVRAGRTVVVTCPHRDLLPADLPHQVRWYPALPFATLMPRIAAVVHHGGILTSARAIASGTPQVVLAHGADRPDNARRLRVLGLAEWLPAARWQVDAVAALIARVLAEPAYRQRAVALASTMDTTTAATRACAHLEDMVGQPRRPPSRG